MEKNHGGSFLPGWSADERSPFPPIVPPLSSLLASNLHRLSRQRSRREREQKKEEESEKKLLFFPFSFLPLLPWAITTSSFSSSRCRRSRWRYYWLLSLSSFAIIFGFSLVYDGRRRRLRPRRGKEEGITTRRRHRGTGERGRNGPYLSLCSAVGRRGRIIIKGDGECHDGGIGCSPL